MAFVRKHAFKIALFALCLAMAAYLLISNLKGEGEKLEVLQKAPDFELTSIDGEQVSLQNTNGKVRIVYFYFASCPDVCPPTTFMLSQVQDQLKEKNLFGEKALLISITFDPERDTPEAIRNFADKVHADYTSWKFCGARRSRPSLWPKSSGSAYSRTRKGSSPISTSSRSWTRKARSANGTTAMTKT
ncbi:SCO family protein [Paenibacillus cisolokensis]|uniref:SCO family protein n=1 Tax=Paenibacillus cisolokensis TaxID=1658519 RepID=UPI001FD15B7D|nr:SCO family protein [Paenibacillus cisolokensis]